MISSAAWGVSLCLSSSRLWRLGDVGLVVAKHCVEDVGSAPGEADDRGVVFLAFGSFTVVVGPAGGIAQRGECGQEQRVLQVLVPAS